jgi:hypothetical protein
MILELTWESGIEVARNRTRISGPHWQRGRNFNEWDDPKLLRYPNGSTHPGVYLFGSRNKSRKLRVKVMVDNRYGATKKFYLRGVLPSSLFSGITLEMKSVAAIPLSDGEHVIEMEIVNLPSVLRHYAGDSKWEVIEEGELHGYSLGERPRLEVFVIYDNPACFYQCGVWVEALRLMFKRASASGLADPYKISERVTQYCHSRHGMRYDTKASEAHFGVDEHGGGFEFMDYIKKVRKVVNCFDQAAAVQSLCGCLGVKVTWICAEPFGCINTINLVGVDDCNNPMYEMEGGSKVVAFNHPDRTKFKVHCFNRIGGDEKNIKTGYILDATVGPCIGTDSLYNYLEKVIDTDVVGCILIEDVHRVDCTPIDDKRRKEILDSIIESAAKISANKALGVTDLE